ncbi:MAG: thiamine diphosphokinase, partial [Desulforhopalus sp.]
MKVFIFANGDLGRPHLLTPFIDQSDLLIAADGGANHCFQLNITPDILLGDLDSIRPAVLNHYRKTEVAISKYPTEKDATDLEIALDLAQEKGAHS